MLPTAHTQHGWHGSRFVFTISREVHFSRQHFTESKGYAHPWGSGITWKEESEGKLANCLCSESEHDDPLIKDYSSQKPNIN